MKIEQVKVKSLIFAEYNPRQLTESQCKDLKDSIERFGFVDPIIVNSNPERENIIIGGHQRARVAELLGIETVPVHYIDLSPEKERELNIRLNKNTGEWDFDQLANYFDNEDLIDWGFSEEELQVFDDLGGGEEGLTDEDDIPEVEEPTTKLGDLWLLGEHRLLCGDATISTDVDRLMGGEKADMVFTDPPYGMKKEDEGVLNDNLNYDDLLEFNKLWIKLSFDNIKDNGSFYCWGTDEPLMDIYNHMIKPLIKNQKATFRNLITWNKSFLKNGNIFSPFGATGMESLRSYPVADEKCIFVMCGVQGFNNNSDNYFEGWEPVRDYLLKSRLEMGWDVPTMKKIVGHSVLSFDHWTSKSQFNFPTKEVYNKMKAEADRIRTDTGNDAFKKEYDELKKEYYKTRAYFTNEDKSNNVWNIELLKNGEEKEQTGGHATPKPIELCERAIKSSCKEEGLVIDFFLGSGSTLIACEKTNRICYGMELDPHYCDVIVKRWEDFTGKKAKLSK